MTREVTVLLFARLRDLAGTDRLSLVLPIASNVCELRRSLSRQVPVASDLIARCAVAINGEYVCDDAAIPDRAEIALIPPVSGGS